MLLEDHINRLNNIYFTLFLNGFNAIQFPDGKLLVSHIDKNILFHLKNIS